MEAISNIVAGYVGDKLAELAEDLVRKHVIERWTRKRAIEFYREFCRELLAGSLSGQGLEDRLDEILSDSKNSEIVWEAYRLVSLSKSRSIGPRIIAVLVAQIVQRDGLANLEEELLLAAAELLSDDDFAQFRQQIGLLQESQGGPELTDQLGSQSIDTNWRGSEIEVGEGSLAREYGLWAQKLASLGLVSQSTRQSTRAYREDSERHIDSDGVLTEYIFSATFHSPCLRLAALVDKVSGAEAP